MELLFHHPSCDYTRHWMVRCRLGSATATMPRLVLSPTYYVVSAFFLCVSETMKSSSFSSFPPPSLLHAVWRWIQSTRGVLAAMISGCYKYFVCRVSFGRHHNHAGRDRLSVLGIKPNRSSSDGLGRTYSRCSELLREKRTSAHTGPICWCDPLVFCGEIAPPLPRALHFSFLFFPLLSPSLPFSLCLSRSLSLALTHTLSLPPGPARPAILKNLCPFSPSPAPLLFLEKTGRRVCV